MIKRLFVSAVIFFVLINYSVSQERKISLADSILNMRGEVFFSFSSAFFTNELSKILSVRNVGERVFAYANKASFERFLELNIDFELQPENFLITRLKSAHSANPDLIYPSYTGYLQLMQGFVQRFNSICELHEIGLSAEGRKLLAVKITGTIPAESKPAVLLTSSIHGNELVGCKLSLWLIDYLLKNYTNDPRITRLLDETEIWVIPLANPDGTYFGGNNTVVQATRFNSNNLDLNRNFPDPEDGQNPDKAARQPETSAIMEFYKAQGVVLSAALHTGDELINYPWDTWPRQHADNDWYRLISRNYVDRVHTKNRFYMTDYENGIVNGFFWYRITGGMQDYVNYFLNSREITIEMSKVDMPDSVTLSKIWDYNREPLLYFIEQSHYGLRGKITSKENGNSLQARIELVNHDKDNSWVNSDAETGIFYRFVAPGNYTLKISAPGFLPFVDDVSLLTNERKQFNIQLEPSKNFVTVYPNPFQESIKLLFKEDLLHSDEIIISLTDLAGKVIYTTEIKGYAGNTVDLAIPSIPDGIYILKVQSKEVSKNFQMLKIK